MTPTTFLLELRERLGSENCAWVLSALFQETLARDFLLLPGKAEQVLEVLSASPDEWNIARLGLLSLGDPLPLSNLRDPDFNALEPELHNLAKAALDTGVAEFQSLSEACLAALALREGYEFHGNWSFLARLIGESPDHFKYDDDKSVTQECSRSACACLIGMVPDPLNLLRALFTIDPTIGLHAFLSIPAAEVQQITDFGELVAGFSPAVRFQALQELASRRPELASQVSFTEAGKRQPAPAETAETGDRMSWMDADQTKARIDVILREAQTLAACQRPIEAIERVGHAQNLNNRWHACLEAYLTSLAAQSFETLTRISGNDDKDFGNAALQAWEQAYQTEPDRLEYRARYAWALLDQGRTAEAEELLEPVLEPGKVEIRLPEAKSLQNLPFLLWGAAARTAGMRNRPKQTRFYLTQGIGQLDQTLADKRSSLRNQLVHLAKLALNSGFFEEAEQLIQNVLKINPVDPQALTISAEVSLLSDEPEKAIIRASSAYGINPGIEHQRLVIRCLEAGGDWSTALGEHQLLISQLDPIQAGDYRRMGACALQTGQPELAIEACQNALEIEPNDGLTYGLLGDIARSEGKLETALEFYKQGIEYSPQAAAIWLCLAKQYQDLEQTQEALETLQQASQALPGSAEIQYQLGKALIAEGLLSSAINPLQVAARLINQDPLPSETTNEVDQTGIMSVSQRAAIRFKIGWRLGKTYQRLGFLEESRRVFESSGAAGMDGNPKATTSTPDPDFSFDYAQTILALGDTRRAIPWLEFAVRNSTNPIARLDLARALLVVAIQAPAPTDTSDELGRAVELLEEILNPLLTSADNQSTCDRLTGRDYAEAYALLAEALQHRGDLTRALHAYRQAIQFSANEAGPSSKNVNRGERKEDWQNRLSLGLGQVAMALGQYETAIAAFLEAIQDDSTNPFLYRCLSEAYAAVDLPSDAFQTANQAVQLDPENPESFVWYADHCLRLYNRPTGKGLPAVAAAMEALVHASEIAPERADLLVRLARIHALRGDHQGVLRTLKRLIDAPSAASESVQDEEPAIEMVITLEDFSEAAEILRQIGQPGTAAVFIERALNLAEVELCSDPLQVKAELYDTLAQTYREVNDLHSSLSAVNRAILVTGEDDLELKWKFLQRKALILLALKNIPEARTCLANAVLIKPDAWEIHFQLALINERLGDLQDALEEGETATRLLVQNKNAATKLSLVRWITAEIAHTLIQDERARHNLAFALTQSFAVENACLLAELELGSIETPGEVDRASAALVSILEIAPHHPHLLALQARLVSRQDGVNDTSLQLFETAASWIDQPHQAGEYPTLPDIAGLFSEVTERFFVDQISRFARIAICNGLAEAALDLGQWTAAEKITGLLLYQNSASPAAHLLRARYLTHRAENQRLAEEILIVSHAPGVEALARPANEEFEKELLAAAENIDLRQNSAVQQVSHWRARGTAVFNPDADSCAALSVYVETSQPDAEDVTALIWCAGKRGDLVMVQNLNSKLPNHPLVCATAAIVLANQENERARLMVQNAIEHLTNPCLSMPNAHPMLLALAAILSFHDAHHPNDYQYALERIQSALEIWPEEARWHDLAAMILLEGPADQPGEAEVNPDHDDLVLHHLELAARLEPERAEHHQKLGRYLALQGETDLALNAFTQAAQAEPDSAEIWLELATIQREIGLLADAIQSVERALAFANQSVEALLLRCELALETNNPRGALSRAQTILNIIPDQPDALYILAQANEALNEPSEALIAVEKGIARLELEASEQPEGLGSEVEDQNEAGAPAKILAMQRLRVRLIQRLYGSKAAIEVIHCLAEVYPADPVINACLADYLLEVGEAEKASQAARNALQTGTWELDSEKQAHLHYLIGVQSRQTGQLDQALYHLNQAIQKSPDFIEAYLELGRTHQDRRQSAQALESFQMAARRMPNDYRPYYLAGLAMKDSKDYLGAETMFRRAAHLAPSEVSIHRQLAAVVALNLIHNRRIAATD